MSPIPAVLPGLLHAGSAFDAAAARLASSSAAADTASLSDEAVSLIAAREAYETGLRVWITSEEMTKSLLDVLG